MAAGRRIERHSLSRVLRVQTGSPTIQRYLLETIVQKLAAQVVLESTYPGFQPGATPFQLLSVDEVSPVLSYLLGVRTVTAILPTIGGKWRN